MAIDFDSVFSFSFCVRIDNGIVYVLYTNLRPGHTCLSKVMHRKEVTHSDGSYEKKSRTRAWLTIWDKVKSHGTVIDWCTCELHDSYFRLMTIKHTIPKIEWAMELSYNSVKTGSQLVLEFRDPLVTRCGRESPHPIEWAPGPPVEQPLRTRKTQRWWP